MHHLRAVFRDAAALVLAADHEPGDVLQKDERNPSQIAELDEMSRLERRFGKQDAIVGDDADKKSVQACEPGDERRRVPFLEFVEPGAVDHPSDDLAHLVRLPPVGADDAVDLRRIVARLLGRHHIDRQVLDGVEGGDNGAADVERLPVALGKVIGDAR